MSENEVPAASEPSASSDVETSAQPAGSEYVDLPPQEEPTYPNTSSLMGKVSGEIRYRYFGSTDVGLVREHNEDNFMVADIDAGNRGIEGDDLRVGTIGHRGVVLAVCDGMGGAAAGEVASQMAVDTLHEIFATADAPADREAFARRLVTAIEESGTRIFTAAKMDRSRRGMGTTSTVAGLVDGVLFVGQVGDSRCYVLRNNKLSLITKDQSLVNQLIEAGQLTEEEAEAFEHSNIILQALGTTERVVVDLTFLELRRGDRVMLCSDGLSGLVHVEMIRDVLATIEDPRDACTKLIEYANNGGGHDNITCVVADFEGEGLLSAEDAPPAAYQQYPLARAEGDEAPPEREPTGKLASTRSNPDIRRPSGYPTPVASNANGEFPWWAVAVAGLVLLFLGGIAWYLAQPPEPPAPAAVATQTQSVRIRTDDETGNLTLYVDGEAVQDISAAAPLTIPLPLGRHRFELRDRSGNVVGASAHEVRASASEQDFMLEVGNL